MKSTGGGRGFPQVMRSGAVLRVLGGRGTEHPAARGQEGSPAAVGEGVCAGGMSNRLRPKPHSEVAVSIRASTAAAALLCNVSKDALSSPREK